MARLCKRMDNIFSDDVLKSLYLRGIWTTVDFLEETPERLATITGLSFKDVVRVRNYIIANFSAFLRKGNAEFTEVLMNSFVVKTGIERLDSLLGGGFSTGYVYEICGPSGSCKTQLCLTLSMNIALNLKRSVFYIDAKSDFSSQRIYSMMDARKIPENIILETLKKIEVVKIKSVFDLFTFLRTLKELLSRREVESSYTKCIILDSLPAVFFPCINHDSNNDGIALMNYLACMMKYLAQDYHVVFLIVNLAITESDISGLQVTNSSSLNAIKPTFGKYWLHIPSTRLLINHNDAQLNIKTIKSTSTPLGSSCMLNITDRGVE